jgi:hypothetical protein
MTRTPRLTMTAPRRFAVTVQSNTGLDLIFVDASTIAYARDQAQLKYGRDVRILATHVVRKGMGESRFDPHGVLAREREAQYKRHALPLAERRALEEQRSSRDWLAMSQKTCTLWPSRIGAAATRCRMSSAARTIMRRCGLKRLPTPMMTPPSESMQCWQKYRNEATGVAQSPDWHEGEPM